MALPEVGGNARAPRWKGFRPQRQVVRRISMPDKKRRRPQPITQDEQRRRTEEWFAACEDIVNLRADIDAQFPQVPEADRSYFIGTLVIENNLGTDWLERNVTHKGPRSPAGAYLRSSPRDQLERHEHYVRTMELARRLFELGQEQFYDELIENLRHRDLEGAAFEADVMRMLCSGPFVIDLRAERGTKGDDYDIDLWLRIDRSWPIEVKTRAENCSIQRSRTGQDS